MVNIFGEVPLVTTTAWAKTSLMPKTLVSDIYRQIVADLKDAEELLPIDYTKIGGERIRAIKWTATALLARVYLYKANGKKRKYKLRL